jgi:hypothetical protein
MRATAPFALSALFLASVCPLALAACNQDYASSNAGRQTFMGDTRQVIVADDASLPKAPPMAPPAMGSPPSMPAMPGDASVAAAAADAGVARPAPRPPPAH